MAKAKRVNDGEGLFYGVRIQCPGCRTSHVLAVDPPNGEPMSPQTANRPRWGFNGNYDAPTFTPSLLCTTGHYAKGLTGPDPEGCWCTYLQQHPEADDGYGCGVCHSFVTNGMIQFLHDSTHHLSGQTVELPELDARK